MIRHLILMSFQPEVAAAKIDEAVERFFALSELTGEPEDIQHGAALDEEFGDEAGCTHCFLINFPDREARDRYITHPAQQEFVSYVMPMLTNGMIVDFESAIPALTAQVAA